MLLLLRSVTPIHNKQKDDRHFTSRCQEAVVFLTVPEQARLDRVVSIKEGVLKEPADLLCVLVNPVQLVLLIVDEAEPDFPHPDLRLLPHPIHHLRRLDEGVYEDGTIKGLFVVLLFLTHSPFASSIGSPASVGM